MKKIHSLCLILILVTAGNCKKESEEVDPVTRLFALQFLLNKKDVFFSTVRFLNEKFYAPGSAGQLYVSTDGDTWTKQSLGTFQTLKDIGFNKDVFTIVGNAVHYSSSDGTTWTNVSTNFSNSTFLSRLGNFGSFSVAFGTDFYTATDGRTFSYGGNLVSTSLSSPAGLFGSAASSTRMVLVGSNSSSKALILNSSVVVTSLTFTSGGVTGISSAASLNDVAFGPSGFVAVGNTGTILYSTLGQTWTTITSGTTNSLRSIVYGNNLFVAVGDSGTILTSTNGLTWTAVSTGSTSSFTGITFGKNKYIAVGKDTILVSSDALTWTSR